MNTHIDKAQQNKKNTFSRSYSQNKLSSNSTFQFVDKRPSTIAQRKLQLTANQSLQSQQSRTLQRIANNSGIIQLNGEWNEFQKAVAEGTMTIEISAKHIKGNEKKRRMVRSGKTRKPTGPFSNQSQEEVLQHAIRAVKDGTARLIHGEGTDFTIEVDSKHGVHGPRLFNIHKGGGGKTTRYIHQISGASSGLETPDNAEYSDSESED